MKILFIARHYTYYRNFESAIRQLAANGHRVHLAVDREDSESIAARLASECHGVTFGLMPRRPDTPQARLSASLRLGIDCLRYADSSYDEAPAIRARATERIPRIATFLAARGGPARAVRWLGALESCVPGGAEIEALLRAEAPDLVLLTPLIELGSPQLDYLRAARTLGIRTALCVWSWDHLSTKALIRVWPDRVLVWNDAQKREAVKLHGIPAARVVVTGAQCFDQWFDREPALDRAAFCRRAGLADTRPYVLYVCSALFRGTCPPEAGFVRRWIGHLRERADPVLRDVPILVRPHPQRMGEWDGIDLAAEFPGVAFFGSNPIDPSSRDDYFDSMYHSAGIVGLNTSALIEAAIVDRPVYTILLPEYHGNQEGTFHFRYLLRVGDGFLHTSRSFEEHAGQLTAGLAGQPVKQNGPFVEEFIRPDGRREAATPRFVAAVEELYLHAAPAPVLGEPAFLGSRPLLAALQAIIATRLGVRLLGNPRWEREMIDRAAAEAERDEKFAQKARVRDQAMAHKRWQRRAAFIRMLVRRTGVVQASRRLSGRLRKRLARERVMALRRSKRAVAEMKTWGRRLLRAVGSVHARAVERLTRQRRVGHKRVQRLVVQAKTLIVRFAPGTRR